MNASHDAMLDDVAVYALGTMSAADAQRVREHLRDCAECRAEYEALAPAAASLALAAEDAAAVPSELMKSRIMREVRREAAPAADPPIRRARPWAAYLVAAACLAFAVYSSLVNLSLERQLKQVQTASTGVSDTTVADLTNPSAQRFPVNGGVIVRVHDRLYLAMHDMPKPPQGKVYQAWTLPKGSKKMAPSVTFVPNASGGAVVALPVDARITTAVAVSVEPVGGSLQPTSKPVLVEQFG